MTHTIPALATAASLLAAAAASAQPRITLIAGGSISDASGDASVLIGTAGDADGNRIAARWTVGATVARTDLGGVEGLAISSDGTAAAGTMLNGDAIGDLPAHLLLASRWTLGSGAWQSIGAFDPPGLCGDTINTPYGISADGRFIVGGAWLGECSGFRAFIYDAQTGAMTNLGGLGNFTDATRANDVSADAGVIVGFDTAPTGARIPAVWRWDPGSLAYVETVLPTAPGQEGGELYEINDAGTIIVGTSSEFPGQLVRWTADGLGGWTAEGLGSPVGTPTWGMPGFEFLSLAPGGMSEDGNVVAGIATYGFFGQRYRGAFIWTPDLGVPKDLRDHLAELPVPPAGLDSWPAEAFTSAIAVSADGRTIVGNPVFVPGAPGAWHISLDGGPCIAPSVAAEPQGAAIDACSSFMVLNAAFSGSAPFTLQWYKDGQPVTDGDGDGNGSEFIGAATAQLLILNATADDAGSYTCVLSNACGDAATAPAVLTVNATIANDTCADAAPIGEGAVTWSPCGALVNDGWAGCAFDSTADVWYRYTPTFTGPADFTTCGAVSMDTVMSIFADGCSGFELACSDNCEIGCGEGFGSSRIDRFFVTAGQPVLVRVASVYPPDSSAVGSLTIAPSAPGPSNDSCDSPAVAFEGENIFDSSTATTDFGVSCAPASSRDVWFSYTPTFTGDARITTCGAAWNTVLSVHSAACGEEVACADDGAAGYTGCGFQASRISRVPVVAGQTVYIRVAGAETCDGGPGSVWISQAPAAPANDGCAAATTVDAGEHAFDLAEATDELTDGCEEGSFNSSRDVWFRLAPSCAGVFTIDTCGSLIFDPMLHIYDACGGAALACSDNVGEDPSCAFGQSRLTDVSAGPASPVLIRVSSAGDYPPFNATGILRITRASPACPADRNCDGAINSNDISEFLTDWLASIQQGTLDADFDGSGTVNSNDISAFLTAWLAAVQFGC